MPQSVLEAIRLGIWNFEPGGAPTVQVRPTGAMRGPRRSWMSSPSDCGWACRCGIPANRISFDDESDE